MSGKRSSLPPLRAALPVTIFSEDCFEFLFEIMDVKLTFYYFALEHYFEFRGGLCTMKSR